MAQWSDHPTTEPVGPPDLDPFAGLVAFDDIGPDEAARLLALLDADACRSSLAEFVRMAWPIIMPSTPLEWGPNLDAICVHVQGQLEDMARKREDLEYKLRAQNLLINCPPRSGKTVLMALASAWAWVRWPWLQILYVSATPSMILDSARMFRDVVSSPWYQDSFVRGAWSIRDDQDALSSMGNTAGGARRGKGFEAKVLGSNSDWLQIDDAHDMNDSIDSILGACDHYDQNLSSRLNDSRWGIRTAIMQRASRRDFSEHVLAQGWFHLRMPMEYELHPECRCPQCARGERGEPNAFGWVDWRWSAAFARAARGEKSDGEVLHPRFTAEYLVERMKVLRPHGYAGQLQQRPSAKEGNQFKVGLWRYHQVGGDGSPRARPPGAHDGSAVVINSRPDGGLDVDWVCLSVDPTGGSTSETASALGMAAIAGKAERRHVLEDLTPGPRTWAQTVKDLPAALARTSDVTGWTSRILVLVEKKALGVGAMSDLEEAIAGGRVKNSRGQVVIAKVEAYEPSGKGNKEHRAEFLEPMQEAGLLTLADGATWLAQPPHGSDQTWVDEFAAFPKGHRDDRVDVLAQCCDRFREDTPEWVRYFQDRARGSASRPTLTPATNPRVCTGIFVDGICQCAVCAEQRLKTACPLTCSCDLSSYVVASATDAGICSACSGLRS